MTVLPDVFFFFFALLKYIFCHTTGTSVAYIYAYGENPFYSDIEAWFVHIM